MASRELPWGGVGTGGQLPAGSAGPAGGLLVWRQKLSLRSRQASLCPCVPPGEHRGQNHRRVSNAEDRWSPELGRHLFLSPSAREAAHMLAIWLFINDLVWTLEVPLRWMASGSAYPSDQFPPETVPGWAVMLV